MKFEFVIKYISFHEVSIINDRLLCIKSLKKIFETTSYVIVQILLVFCLFRLQIHILNTVQHFVFSTICFNNPKIIGVFSKRYIQNIQ